MTGQVGVAEYGDVYLERVMSYANPGSARNKRGSSVSALTQTGHARIDTGASMMRPSQTVPWHEASGACALTLPHHR